MKRPEKPNNRKALAIAMAACLILQPVSMALAEKAKGGGDAEVLQTLKKAQGMLRQLSQEKSELEAKLAGMSQELDTAKKTVQTQEADLKQKTAILEQLQKNNEILKANNDRLRQDYGQQLQSARNQMAELNKQLQVTTQDNGLLVQAVKERTAGHEKCVSHNSELINASRQMLDDFENGGFWDDVKTAGPLTGIASVEKENKIQVYRFRLEDLKVTPWGGEQPAPPQSKP